MADIELLDQFRQLMGEFKTANDAALQQIREKGELTGEVKERVVKIEADVAGMVQKMDAMTSRLSKAPGAYGSGAGDDVRAISEQLTEHTNYKSQTDAQRPRIQVTLKGRLERRAVTITEAGSGYPITPQRVGVFTEPAQPLTMRDLVDVVPIGATNAVDYVKETWNFAADYQVAEGDKKAQSDVTYTDATANVRTIAHFIKISRQMLADVPYVRGTIDTRMIYGVRLKEDREILLGDNAAGHLHGILPQATAYAPVGTPDNNYDEIYQAILQVASKGYAVSAVVINPTTWGGLALMKTAQGVYYLGGPPQSDVQPRMWGVPVVPNMHMPAGQFLVGAFRGNAALFDRETPSVDIAFENEDDFVRNLVTIRCEERVAFAVYVPLAFVKGTLSAPAPGTAALSGERKK